MDQKDIDVLVAASRPEEKEFVEWLCRDDVREVLREFRWFLMLGHKLKGTVNDDHFEYKLVTPDGRDFKFSQEIDKNVNLG